jgi:hypothetical protein
LRHYGIKVSTGYWPERQHDRNEYASRRKRIREKRDRDVTARKPLRHDTGAHDTSEQDCSTYRFGS